MKSGSFTSWLSRQSLPRLLGLLLGNTRELETRITDSAREVERLVSEIDWWKAQYQALTDSWLLSRGAKPTDPALVVAPTENGNGKKPVILEKYEVEIEAEKVMEMLWYRPTAFTARIEELEHSKVPRDQEILRRVKIKFAEQPEDSNDGVVIGV